MVRVENEVAVCISLFSVLFDPEPGLGTSTVRRPAEHALRSFTARGPILASLRLGWQAFYLHPHRQVQIGFGATTGGVTTLELHRCKMVLHVISMFTSI